MRSTRSIRRVLATNYLPPDDYSGELLVFTLDGTSGFPPFVRIGLEWYDDDEVSQSDFFDFECFDIVEYDDVAPGLGVLETSGHMEMEPREAFATPPHGGRLQPHYPLPLLQHSVRGRWQLHVALRAEHGRVHARCG